ncbi:MAG: hypothetical protein MK237_07300, partial [Gemmatimonadetes bacterium]|nr:hypothetical protein [Gemmatimonadota bacterium]
LPLEDLRSSITPDYDRPGFFTHARNFFLLWIIIGALAMSNEAIALLSDVMGNLAPSPLF